MSEEENSNEEKEENEENEDKEEEDEDNKEEKEDNEENELNLEDNDEEGEKDDNKEEEKNNDKTKKDSSLNKFRQSKLKPSSEIKINLKSNESNNNFVNKLNVSNHSILTAAFTNNPPPNQIPFIPFNRTPIQLKSNLQIITDINKDMDLLSSKLNRKIIPFKLNGGFTPFKNDFYESNFNQFDKEDFEIKQLINKANDFTNTNYTTFKNNLTYNHNLNNFMRNSKKYKNKYFHTINNYSESSIDSKDLFNAYNNKHFNTLPNFRNNYPKENQKRYFVKNNNNLNLNNIYDGSNLNPYKTINHEDSVYSNEIENEKDYHHNRYYRGRNYFINNNKNRAATYNGRNKINNYLNENDSSRNDKSNSYLKTFDQTRNKPLIYIQPESSNLYQYNRGRKNLSSNSKNYIVNRDNYRNKKKSFYRLNTENDKRAVNILMGNE